MIQKLQNQISAIGNKLGFRRDWYLMVLAAGIGTITAGGAIFFMELLRWAEHNAIEVQHALPLWTLPLLPMGGALLTGLLVYFFAREARGHGIPEVMYALYRNEARIRPRVALVKSLASACTIGSGGSAGAEGPIVQIGSAIGSGLAQLLRVSRDQASTLLGCGAAAGIASVFNAPIAGVFFVLEILLRDFSLRTFTPIIVASVFSATFTQAWYGKNDAIFAVPEELAGYKFTIAELPSYLVLGIVCGIIAVAFIRLLYLAEDLFEKLRVHPIVKPVIGALMLGVLGIAFLFFSPTVTDSSAVPPFFGNGYETIRFLLQPGSYDTAINVSQALNEPMAAASGAIASHSDNPHGQLIETPVSTAMWMLMILLLAKAIATSLTLGSGGSGGVFAPSLFLGATTGALFGVVLDNLGLLPEGGSPAAYSLVGMAAVVAGTTHAPLTAILILSELTRDPYVLLPIMIAAVFAVVVAQLIRRDSIYSLKLRRRGVLVGTATDLTLLRKLTARDITPGPHTQVLPEDPVSKLLDLRDRYRINDFVVTDAACNFVGMVTGEDLRAAILEQEAIPYLVVAELIRRDLPMIDITETLDVVLEKFSKHPVASLPLVDRSQGTGRKVIGLITRARLMHRYQQALMEH